MNALSGDQRRSGLELAVHAVAMLALLAALGGLVAGGAWRWLALPALAAGAVLTIRARSSLRNQRDDLGTARIDLQRLIDIPTQVHFIADAEGNLAMVGRRWSDWTGLSPEESRTGGWFALIHDEDQARVIAARANALGAGEPLDQEFRIRMKTGHQRWVRMRAFPQRKAPEAALDGWIGTVEDVHDRRIAEEQLRQTATMLEMIGTSTESLIYAKDRDGRMLYANRALERLAGVSLAEILGKTDAEWTANPIEAEAFASADRVVMESGLGQDLEEMFTGLRGETGYFRSLKSPLRDRSGQVVGIVGVSTDVTEKREAEQRERLLTRELDHRAKNLLAVVQSVVQLTRAPTIEAFKAAVSGRIQALGRAHNMLAASRWEGADLQRVLSEELEPYRDSEHGRVHLAGPPLTLKPAAAQSLSLVIHELATNAAKYGALSLPDGRLDVRWELASAAAGQGPILRLTWQERDGPAVAARDGRSATGFGSRLIRSSIERQLGGTLAMDWDAEGLTARFDVALDRSLSDVSATPGKTPRGREPRLRGRGGRQVA